MAGSAGADGRRPASPAFAEPSPRVASLVASMDELALATDDVASAVARHDHEALVAANERSNRLIEQVARHSARLTELDRPEAAAAGIVDRAERLREGARRNAYLIERAWATDAALMRLLAGLARRGGEAAEYAGAENGCAPGAYGAPSVPAYLDRGA